MLDVGCWMLEIAGWTRQIHYVWRGKMPLLVGGVLCCGLPVTTLVHRDNVYT